MAQYAPLQLSSTVAPASQEELARLVREAHESGTALFPIGGGTSLGYGLPSKQSGVGVVMTGLNRVIDFPARDLTVTVEAGIGMEALAALLASEGLRLPVDVPQANKATLGGVIATGWSGPRRYGHGTIRDFVIGIRAVDGRGEVFNGGGRVVKNVAGYDFCKLLTGSLGTIGVISQVTLKLRPLAEQTVLVSMALADLEQAEKLGAALALSEITPAAIELKCVGEERVVYVLLEGSHTEVEWQQVQLAQLALKHSLATQVVPVERLNEFIEFPAASAPLVLKASVTPSSVIRFVEGLQQLDARVVVQAALGNGIVYAAFPEFPSAGLSRTLIGQLQPLAASVGGHVVVLANPGGQEATPQSTWGTLGAQHSVMQAVKQEFDPRNILNPGRYVFA